MVHLFCFEMVRLQAVSFMLVRIGKLVKFV